MSGRVAVRIMLNGREREVGEGTVLSELLSTLELPPDGCAVELNGRLVPRTDAVRVPLHAGDRVEVVTLVGGG
jgi:sulfur carrier protein